MNKIFLLLLFLALIPSGCEKSNFSAPSAKQLVLFQVEYINYAWVYSHSGIIIDSAGNVRRFNFPEKWHYADSTGYITESDMNENFKQLGNVSLTIGKDSLDNYFSKVKGAAEGKLSDPYSRMADAGTTTFSGYFYYALEKKYKVVMIKQTGDIEVDNYSKEAEDIYQWLLSILSNSLSLSSN